MNKLGNNEYIVGKNIFKAYTKSGKVVFFQKKCDGDGTKLYHATLKHQLNAITDAVKGINFVHKKGFVHQDIKPQNILIVGNVQGEEPVKGKLSDFNLMVKRGIPSSGGTPFYMPPEAFGLSFANEKKDSYSLGITILCILTNQNPLKESVIPLFTQFNKEKFDQKVREFLGEKQLEIEKNGEMERNEKDQRIKMLQVCYNLIQYDPQDRLTCLEVEEALVKIQYGIEPLLQNKTLKDF